MTTLDPFAEPTTDKAGERFCDMTDDELLDHCRALYTEGGITALSYEALKGNLYTTLYHRGFRQRVLLEKLGLREEYNAWLAEQPLMFGNKVVKRWSWKRVIEEARQVQAKQGFLPPAAWFAANGMSSLAAVVYTLGHTWEDLRDELGDFRSSQFIQSRNGMRWRSHAEASLSNFLHARGIPHTRGERYPEDYEVLTDRAYGIYDMHFEGKLGRVDIEIWGDKPNGSDPVRYQKKRDEKEQFNSDNPGFLGIDFRDCYSEERLMAILEPHIGIIEPFVFDKPIDSVISSTHWSNAEELIEYCRKFVAEQTDGIFPTEEWLRKRGKWATREGPAYNTLAIYIWKWVGGVRQLREILGQPEASTIKWSRKLALERWKAFREKYGISPGSMKARARRGQGVYPEEALREATILVSAVVKYVGNSAVADAVTGFEPSRKTVFASPEHRAVASAASKKMWIDPETRPRLLAAQKSRVRDGRGRFAGNDS